MTDETEKLRLIESLGKLILRASEALERQDWSECEKLLYKSARECRMIILSERQRQKDVDDEAREK